MNVIAIIPARWGSKRFPQKNFVEFDGETLVARAARMALESGKFKQVIVTTDAEEPERYLHHLQGVRIHQRSVHGSSDDVQVLEVCAEVLRDLELRVDYVCLLLPTSPLRAVHDIQQAVQLATDGKYDAVMSVCEYFFPVGYAFDISKDKRLQRRFPELAVLGSDKHPPAVVSNGAISVLTPAMVESGTYVNENSIAYEMPKLRSIDIDEREDLDLARAVLHMHRNET